MSKQGWHIFPQVSKLLTLLKAPPLDLMEHERLLRTTERNIVLPVKALFLMLLGWSFYYDPWFTEGAFQRSFAVDVIENFYLSYAIINVLAGLLLLIPRRWPLAISQWTVFSVSIVDSVFVASLMLIGGGYDGILFWLLPALIVRNAICVPLARQQIILNLSVAASFVIVSVIDLFLTRQDIAMLDETTRRTLEIAIPEHPGEIFVMRLIILMLFGACCYGVQVVIENERRLAEESRESAARQGQLRAAGRMAAEIAHKIKNPLGIINNAAFNLQRALENGQTPRIQQVQMIREEIEKSDRIITDLMGYARLAEGQVEKLVVAHELNRAILSVFPPGASYSIQIHTDYEENLPPLFMQRNHFNDILCNILVNAREALAGIGQITIRAWATEDMLHISIKDDGPGIPPDKQQQVFESYYTTKEKGTGLGLAIVRQNVEMYQGTVRVASVVGEGSDFIIELPTRTFMRKKT